jgi:hypothetical protein
VPQYGLQGNWDSDIHWRDNDGYHNLTLEEEKQSFIVPYISCSAAWSNELNEKNFILQMDV